MVEGLSSADLVLKFHFAQGIYITIVDPMRAVHAIFFYYDFLRKIFAEFHIIDCRLYFSRLIYRIFFFKFQTVFMK